MDETAILGGVMRTMMGEVTSGMSAETTGVGSGTTGCFPPVIDELMHWPVETELVFHIAAPYAAACGICQGVIEKRGRDHDTPSATRIQAHLPRCRCEKEKLYRRKRSPRIR